MRKDTYTMKQRYSTGTCQLCDKEVVDGSVVRILEKVDWFRGDDEELACWCQECYDKISAKAKVIIRLCKLMRPQDRWEYRYEDGLYVADALVSLAPKGEDEMLSILAYHRKQLDEAIAAFDKIF